MRTNSELYQNHPDFNWRFVNAAVSGRNTWNNLVRLSAEILAYAPDLVVLECVNDGNTIPSGATVEAFIRRVWAARPTARVLVFNFFAVADPNVNANVNSPVNEADILALEAVVDHYSLPLMDYWGRIQELVNNQGHDLDEYMADTVHPLAAGHSEAYALLESHLFSGGSMPSSLPARLYAASADYERTPSRILGTGYDSRTGTWSDTDTRTQSSEVGATITYHATCLSIGSYRADGGTNTVQVSVDGGAFADFVLYENGTALPEGDGAHTFVIKVVSGTVRIDEFLAI